MKACAIYSTHVHSTRIAASYGEEIVVRSLTAPELQAILAQLGPEEVTRFANSEPLIQVVARDLTRNLLQAVP